MKHLLLLVALSFCLIGCTEQERAKKWGGTATMKLPPGAKLVMLTWKGDQLWVLHRARRPDEKVETYNLKENSSWGVVEGLVRIEEQ